MNSETLLHRQINPSWMHDGRVSSQAYRPTEKDDGLLSTYDGDQIDASASFKHYAESLGFVSIGVMALSISEFEVESLPARPDPLVDFKEHAVVDYTAFVRKQRESKSKKLQVVAQKRGWLYQPSK